jgi:hypothetical protein
MVKKGQPCFKNVEEKVPRLSHMLKENVDIKAKAKNIQSEKLTRFLELCTAYFTGVRVNGESPVNERFLRF